MQRADTIALFSTLDFLSSWADSRIASGYENNQTDGRWEAKQYKALKQKQNLTLLLAAPRGFCAGVERAIKIVELALQKYGPPVYVRHEIVHNRFVVERLEAIGAIFIDDLAEAPEGAQVIFSAHGVPKSVPAEAERRHLSYFDATCPLVSKVHVEADRHFKAGREIVLIGHDGHPEVEGTMGQLPKGAISLVETASDAEAFSPTNPERLAYITQTTLSVDDTANIVSVLRRRFPKLSAPTKRTSATQRPIAKRPSKQ